MNLTNYFVQYGIDLYGCLNAGVGWPAFGGHRSGRKLPIVFAGILLNNDGMENFSANHPNQLGEDMQIVDVNLIPPAGTYQQAWQGAKKAQNVWNYQPFFDYVDRWMMEDDTQAVAEIKAQTGFDYTANWERQGQTRFWLQGEFPQYTFIDDMWTAYRPTN